MIGFDTQKWWVRLFSTTGMQMKDKNDVKKKMLVLLYTKSFKGKQTVHNDTNGTDNNKIHSNNLDVI